MAAKLSEDPNVSVVVLEAGAANLNDPAICMPPDRSAYHNPRTDRHAVRGASYGQSLGDKQYDWVHTSVSVDDSRGDRQLSHSCRRRKPT